MARGQDPKGYQLGGLKVSRMMLDKEYEANKKKLADFEYEQGSTAIGKIFKKLITGKRNDNNPYMATQAELFARKKALDKKIQGMKNEMKK
jgi:hypothetical protein